MISLIRVDERLIHGQVAYSWTNAYPSQALMVITEEQKNELERMSLEMACPRNLKCFIVTVDEAVKLLNQHADKRIFIVTDSCNTVLSLLEKGIDIQTVNLGGIYHKDGREQISKTVYVDQNIKKTLKEINKFGTSLEIRATPSDKSIDIMEKI